MKYASKSLFFVNFRKLQKKLPICKKKFAEILNVARAVVTNVEKKSNRHNRIFFGSAKVAPGCRESAMTRISSNFFSTILESLWASEKNYVDFKKTVFHAYFFCSLATARERGKWVKTAIKEDLRAS